MTGKKSNIKPDISLKGYWNRNEEFADLFNALLYGGKNVIKAEMLREKDTEGSVIMQIGNETEGTGAVRDLFKVVMGTDDAEYALLGIENQQEVHYAMPLRDMEYSVYSYHKQYEKIKEKYPNKKGLKGNEFLSHMKKTDKLIPTVNVIIYYGDAPWDGAKSLYEMMDIEERLKPFVSDHKMNLIEAGRTELVFHNKSNQDLFKLLHFIYGRKDRNRKAQITEYIRERNVEPHVIQAIASIGGISLNMDEKEGAGIMCEFFEELKDEGRIEGIIEGRVKGKEEGLKEGRAQEIIEMGREFKLSEDDVLRRLQDKLCISLNQARDYFKIFSGQQG